MLVEETISKVIKTDNKKSGGMDEKKAEWAEKGAIQSGSNRKHLIVEILLNGPLEAELLVILNNY